MSPLRIAHLGDKPAESLGSPARPMYVGDQFPSQSHPANTVAPPVWGMTGFLGSGHLTETSRGKQKNGHDQNCAPRPAARIACSTALLISPASATDVVITSGTTNANNVLLGGADTLTVQTNATTTNSAGSAAAVSQFSNTTGAGIVITNNGTIANTRTGSGPSVTYVGPGKTYALDGFSTSWGTGTTIYTGNIAITNTGSITSVGGPAIFFAPRPPAPHSSTAAR